MNNTDPEINEEIEDKTSRLNPKISPVVAALIGLVLVFVLYQIVGSVISLLIFGFNLQEANIHALRLFTVAGQILLILLPALILSKSIYQDVSTVIRYKYPSAKEIGFYVLGLVILTPFLQNLLFIQNYFITYLADLVPFIEQAKTFLDQLDKLIEETYKELITANSFFEASFIVMVVAITPAICEEVFFRGFVQKSFELKTKPVTAVLLTAFFFAAYHFSPYGLIALLILGAYFGLTAYLSGSIFIPIILHFLNNLFALIVFFIFGEEDFVSTTVMDKSELLWHSVSFVILLVVFILFFRFIVKNYKNIKTY